MRLPLTAHAGHPKTCAKAKMYSARY